MSERTNIMSACEYSIASLQNIKKGLLDMGSPNQQIAWAIGGIIISLVSNLMKICQEVVDEAAQSGNPNAREDLTKIKTQFNEFIDHMIGSNE